MMKLQEFGKGIWANDPQLLLADYYFVENGFKKTLQIQTVDSMDDYGHDRPFYEVRVQNEAQDSPNDECDSKNSIIKMGMANWRDRADIAKNDPSYTEKIFDGEYTTRKADCLRTYNWWLRKIKLLINDPNTPTIQEDGKETVCISCGGKLEDEGEILSLAIANGKDGMRCEHE